MGSDRPRYPLKFEEGDREATRGSSVSELRDRVETTPQGPWAVRHLRHPFFLDVFFTNTPHSRLDITVSSMQITIPFVSHAWSGVVEIYVDKSHYNTLDLYSPNLSYISYQIEFTELAEHHISIVVSDRKHYMSYSTEVFVGHLSADYITPPVLGSETRRLFPLTEALSFIDGTHGSFLVINTDIWLSRRMITDGQWAPELEPVFRRFIAPGSIVFDIGANIGDGLILLSKLASENGRVYGFEPERHCYYTACANVLINQCENVEVLQCAVGTHEGVVPIPTEDLTREKNWGGLGIPPEGAHRTRHGRLEDVPLISLDRFVAQKRVERVDFIKIDVQGFELFVLQGAIETLSRHRPAILLEISPHLMRPNGYSYLEIYHLLQELGYQLFDVQMEPLQIGWKEEESFYEKDTEWDILAVQPTFAAR